MGPPMIHILVLAHGNLANELVKSAEMIIGSVPEVYSIGLDPSENLEHYEGRIRKVIEGTASDEERGGVIIFADMFGGSCANVASKIVMEHEIDNSAVITGVNLPMLLDTIINRDVLAFDAVKQKALDAGSRSIIDMSKLARKNVG